MDFTYSADRLSPHDTEALIPILAPLASAEGPAEPIYGGLLKHLAFVAIYWREGGDPPNVVSLDTDDVPTEALDVARIALAEHIEPLGDRGLYWSGVLLHTASVALIDEWGRRTMQQPGAASH